MNRRGWLFFTVVILFAVCAAGYGMLVILPASNSVDEPVNVAPELNANLTDFHHSFLSQTTRIRTALLTTADALSVVEQGDPRLDVILRDLYLSVPASAGVCYVQDTGVVGRSAPLASLYSLVSRSELRDINADSFVNRSILFVGPIYSPAYGEVVCFAAPIYDSANTYKGYACIALWPGELISDTSFPGSRSYNDTTYRPWVVFTDGLVLSSPSTTYVGDNVLDSATIRRGVSESVIRQILDEKEGAIRLSASSGRIAVWTTAEVNGREMRLILSTAELRSDIPLEPVNRYSTDVHNATTNLYLYASEHGQEQTLAELANPQGIFASEKLRYFAYDFNGTSLYDGFNPQYAGENMLNFRDSYGLRPVATERFRAWQGGGYTYMYAPVQSGEPDLAVLCILYVLPVDDTWFVVVSQSILDHTVKIDPSKRNVVLSTVHNASSYILIHGKEAAFQEFMNPDSSLLADHRNLFAMNYNGTILMDILNPEMVGADAFYFTDMHGASTMREIAMLGRAGGGYCYLGVTNSTTQESMICLVYVEPQGDDWCLGSSIMLETIPLDGGQQVEGLMPQVM